MGVVYKAEDTMLGRTVPPRGSRASALNHPNICTRPTLDLQQAGREMRVTDISF
jgi:hypothetical protein